MIVGIIGSGQWGRALATLTAEAGHQPRMGYRSKPVSGFPGTPNLQALTREADLTIVAVPPADVADAIASAQPGPGSRVLIATRGLTPNSGKWLSDIVIEGSACRRVGAIAGPALAAEVMGRRPSALVAASRFAEVRDLSQQALHSSICRVYTSPDLRGVELAGAMVGVLTVAVGIADAMRLGVGAHGVVVTRGLAEATRLGLHIGTDAATFAGLAGLGDLVACGAHPEHPGYQAGQRLAKGGGAETRVIAEAAALLALAARHNVDLPLTRAIAAIASQKLKPRLAFDKLMRREARAE